MKVALLQLNPTVGDLQGNAGRIAASLQAASSLGGIDLAVTPELALVGYLPRDLLLSEGFVRKSWETLAQLAQQCKNLPPILVGIPEPNPSDEGRPLFNSAVLLHGGEVGARFRKALLPTYDVFDEDRYFEPFHGPQTLDIGGRRLGISICEDIWNDRDFWKRRRYHHDPIEELVRAGADAIVNMSASPFTAGKQARREEMLGSMARRHRVPVLYVNQFGGNDDLTFDGCSCAFNGEGQPIARAGAFCESNLVCDFDAPPIGPLPQIPAEQEIWRALVHGTMDYVRKCGFRKVLLGLSGGIDSAVTAAIAVDALGRDNVTGVLMPSPFSSEGSVSDARHLAEHLRIPTVTIPIETVMRAYDAALQDEFNSAQDSAAVGLAKENLQARIRGALLMALSNSTGAMLLTTGNKSEMAVGYCTLYGDMNGGLAVIADVPKTMVYRLARWKNTQPPGAVIPEETLSKAPSAELRANQTDQDSLPPYDVLDEILHRHIEQHLPADDIIAAGFDADTVHKVLKLVRAAEFKRKQAAPGLKVTDRAFGTGWRMPIARK